MIYAKRVKVPEFELVSNPTIHIANLKRRFRLINTSCPVCGQFCHDLLNHVNSMDDDAHTIYLVCET